MTKSGARCRFRLIRWRCRGFLSQLLTISSALLTLFFVFVFVFVFVRRSYAIGIGYLDFTRFNRHLLRSKLNWRVSHEESQIPGGI